MINISTSLGNLGIGRIGLFSFFFQENTPCINVTDIRLLALEVIDLFP